jgi:hypothetical protein
MKTLSKIITLSFLFFFLISCSKSNQQNANQTFATIVTLPVETVTTSTTLATCGGNITNDGGSPVTDRGIVWSLNKLPTLRNISQSCGNGTGSFRCSLSGLIDNKSYYVRSYATNSYGTIYGNQLSLYSFACSLPTVSTSTVETIASTTSVCGGNITNDGGAPIINKGLVWSTNPMPTILDDSISCGANTGSFTNLIKGLSPNTTYYIRAFASNLAGLSYGNQVVFNTISSNAIAVGQFQQGGIVFYVDASGQHGLVAASSDQSSGAIYGCRTTLVNASGFAIGTGNQNTSRILTFCTTQGIAAKICSDLVLNGYNDWFLPSVDELNQMYIKRITIGGFNAENYVSSTEDTYGTPANNCRFQHFGSGGTGAGTKGGLNYRVRAVRSF